jgi:drug/metabolite transporter (DMT)-like permease
MAQIFYWIGVSLAILSGMLNNFGTVIQKKVVNEFSGDSKFMRNVIKKPLWILGLVLGLGIGSILFLTAQVFIGPALIPGLMASGLIILAIGSIKIVGESLNIKEIIGIIIMILAIFLLGISGLSIDIVNTNLLEVGFIIRTAIFTGSLTLFSILCQIFQKRDANYRGIFLAVLSGFMYSLSNFWVSPLMAVMAHVLSGDFELLELVIFIISAIILILTNTLGIITITQAFRIGQASNLVPIQQVPIQITPIFVYLLVFLLIPPNIFSILYLVIGVILILISSFLLGKRQEQLEEVK